jgi:hypothetical protein
MSIDFLPTINKNGYSEWMERIRKKELDYYLLTID